MFACNGNDGPNVKDIVARTEIRYCRQRIWIVNRLMVSEATLDWLNERGSQDIAGLPRSWLKEFADALHHGSWTALGDGLEVQQYADAHGIETRALEPTSCMMIIHFAFHRSDREEFPRAEIRIGMGQLKRWPF